MTDTQAEAVETKASNRAEAEFERWNHWHLNWTAVWVGALAAFSMVLLFGLAGTAVGAHMWGNENRVVEMKKVSMQAYAFCVFGSFFSFVVGGWIAGKIAGVLHAEPGMLYGAVAWLLAVPVLLLAAELGGSRHLGGWYVGLSSASGVEASPFARPDPLPPEPTREEVAAYRAQSAQYVEHVKQWQLDGPKVARNGALGALIALLLGLIGAVIGGWMACGEPMSLTHHRSRIPRYSPV